MSRSAIKNIYERLVNSGFNSVFYLYSVFMILFTVFYVFVLQKNPDFFITDDGYYTIGKLFYQGKSTLLHQSRGPGLYLLFSAFNIFPEVLHPYLRIAVTMITTYGILYFASRIFSGILNREQLFWGLFISVFNPLYIHFTIKNTPEVYTAFFLGAIILSYKLFIETAELRYALLAALSILLGMTVKPVFFLIPAAMIVHVIMYKKSARELISVLLILFVALSSYFAFQSLTRQKDGENFSYGFTDIMSRVYIYDAMLESGEINLGTTEELLATSNEKSNYIICDNYFKEWLKEYRKSNPDGTEPEIALNFTKDNLFRSVLLRVTSPVLFISLTSNSFETYLLLAVNSFLVITTLISIKRIYKNQKPATDIILFTLAGYFLVFFLTLSYARYSMPFMSYFLVFNGVFINGIIKNRRS